MTKRYWYSLELPTDAAERFQDYMREHDIRFEPSSAYTLVHLQCFMSEEECKLANQWLSETN